MHVINLRTPLMIRSNYMFVFACNILWEGEIFIQNLPQFSHCVTDACHGSCFSNNFPPSEYERQKRRRGFCGLQLARNHWVVDGRATGDFDLYFRWETANFRRENMRREGVKTFFFSCHDFITLFFMIMVQEGEGKLV